MIMKHTKWILMLMLLQHQLQAQNNYWTQQYGAQSSLLGGAVVAGVRDNSALYYNPAALGFIEHPTLSINANIYQLDYVNLKNGAGNQIDLNSIRPLIYPQLVSGFISFKKVPKLKMAYGLLTRHRNDIKTYAQHKGFYEIIPSSGGLDYYYANINYEINNISQWGGLGISYKISNKVSLGFTQFLNYMHLDDRLSNNTSIDVMESTYYITRVYESSVSVIDAVSMNWKIGAAFDFGKFKMGITGTIPSVDLFGFARLERSLESFNQHVYLDDSLVIGKFPSFIVSEEQRGLNARFRTPGSIALGLELNLPKSGTRIMLTGEYFFPMSEYTVARYDSLTDIRPFGSYQNIAVPDFLVETTFSAGVINVGIGYEQRLHDKWMLCMGVRSDMNNTQDVLTSKPYGTNSINSTFWHYVHFSAGVRYKKGSSDVTFGLNYGLGITNIQRQPFNIAEPQISLYPGFYGNPFISFQGERQETMKANVHSIGIVLGYTYYIKR